MATDKDIVESYVACQGENGACGYTVAQRTDIKKAYRTAPQPTYEEVFELLTEGRSATAVVAIHNERTGNIVEPLDLIARHNVGVIGEVYQRIDHYVLITRSLALQFGVLPKLGASEDDYSREEIQVSLNASPEKQEAILSAITEIRSDEQGLRQCGDFVSRNMPAARRVVMSCTASAAKSIKTETDDFNTEVMNPPYSLKVAAIASAYCAKMYDLIVVGRVQFHPEATLAPETQPLHIQDYGKDNVTRYLTLQRGTPPTEKFQKETADYLINELMWDETAMGAVPEQKAKYEALLALGKKNSGDRETVEARDAILGEPAGFITAAKIWHFVEAMKSDKKKNAAHSTFRPFQRIAKLCGFRSYAEPSWFRKIFETWLPLARASRPFEDMTAERRQMFEVAKKDVDTALTKLRSGRRDKDNEGSINVYRSFIVLTASAKQPNIYPALGELLGNKHVDAALVQVLPPESKAAGMRALIELKAYLTRGPRGGLTGEAKVIEHLNSVARNADGAGKGTTRARGKDMPTYKFKGCILARNVRQSVSEGQMVEAANRDKAAVEDASPSFASADHLVPKLNA